MSFRVDNVLFQQSSVPSKGRPSGMSQRRALLAKAQVVVLQSCFSVTSVFSPVCGRSLFQSHGHLHRALVSPSPERHRSQLLSPPESLTLQEPSHIHSSYVHAHGHLKSDLAVYGSSHSSPYSYSGHVCGPPNPPRYCLSHSTDQSSTCTSRMCTRGLLVPSPRTTI